ncbi:MBL fold metallo-hydrolase [Listeria sp. PSOL-1]|uniref:MBL fold metallo-hydrolase n=1 Tax=Listeria sp. PSOL-1 TaxID=1844999 RepID=UPI0013D478A5|nr:MBL fold metallo-hydrolase [Listeria sp. PSOL-1]
MFKKIILLAVFVLFILTGCSYPNISSSDNLTGARFSFFDVGQGDSTLIQAEDGTTILIDTGRQDNNHILEKLQQKKVSKIDLLLLTHPHADHIGYADKVIEKYKPREIWMSGFVFNSSIYERVIDAALASSAKYKEPRRGNKANFGPFEIEVLSPDQLSEDANNNSLCIRLTYGRISAIFTGDAEKSREQEMVHSGLNLKADILDLGHHGSSTSNQPFFLDKVQPKIAVYSAEQANRYGHPHQEVLTWLNERHIKTLGTDVNGEITITTDGKTFHTSTEKEGIPKPGSSYSAKEKIRPHEKMEGAKSEEMPNVININRASKEELQFLPLVGPELAEKIIRARPYHSIDDLKRVNGIGNGIVRQIKAQGIAQVK